MTIVRISATTWLVAGSLLIAAPPAAPQTSQKAAPQAEAQAAQPAPKKPVVLPKADVIMDRYVQATGGRAAYEKRKTEISIGTMEVTGRNIKGTATTYATAGGNTYSAVEIAGVGKIESGVTDGVVWEQSALQGARIKQGDEKTDSLRDMTFNAPIHWRQIYEKVETVALETMEGQACYKLTATPPSGRTETLYFSKDTGLLVRRDKVMTSPMGEVAVQYVAAEYTDFNGVKVPSRMVQRAAGQEFVVTIDSVKINEEIPAERFEMPADVKALLAKDEKEAPQEKDGK